MNTAEFDQAAAQIVAAGGRVMVLDTTHTRCSGYCKKGVVSYSYAGEDGRRVKATEACPGRWVYWTPEGLRITLPIHG